MQLPHSLVLCALVGVAACAEDIRPQQPDAGEPGGDGGDDSHVTHHDNGDGTTTTQVDAVSEDAWIHLDLDSKAEVDGADSTWDLSFQRYRIRVDGGVSGDGGVEIAVLPAADFDAMTAAPRDGYFTDAADGADEGADPDLAFLSGDGWYSYDVATHVLTPRDVVYVVRTGAGAYLKLQFVDYYDDAGTGGFPTFRWAPIAAPSGSDELAVDASAADAWIYVDVEDGIVQVADPATSDTWDLAFSRTRIRTNGGTSGGGLGGARAAADAASFDGTTAASTLGFEADAMIPIPGPPGSGEFSGSPILNSWYDYDPATHVVTSKQLVYLVRTAQGDYAKLQITDYASGVLTLRLAPVDRAIEVVTRTIAATDAAAWVYLDLRRNAEVTIADPQASPAWDLALSRTRIATNSGTSGAATGGAAASPAADLDAVVTTAGEYAVDAMLPNPGPPGSGEYSGNPVLADWYDYDPQTHVVSPKDRVFLVRTADGGFAKLEITAYSGGTFTIAYAYAGAGRDAF